MSLIDYRAEHIIIITQNTLKIQWQYHGKVMYQIAIQLFFDSGVHTDNYSIEVYKYHCIIMANVIKAWYYLKYIERPWYYVVNVQKNIVPQGTLNFKHITLVIVLGI